MSASRQHQVAPTQIGSILGSSIPQPGLPVSTIDGKPYAWGGIHTPNWSAELGGDNKLVVTTMNVNEILKVNILDGLDFQGTLGYSTNNAARDEQYLSIDWYQYDGTIDYKTRTLPILQKKNHRILKALHVPIITRHQLFSLIRNYLMRLTTYRLWEVCNMTMPLTIIAVPKQWTWKRQSNRLTVKDKST